MKSYTTLTNLFTSLSQNTSTENSALGGQLINDQHRYLLQKYFDNEKTFTALTVGAETLTVTVAPAVGDTSATLSVLWPHNSASQLVVFSSGEQRTVRFLQNNTAIEWDAPLTKIATTSLATIGVQEYEIPADVSKIKNSTITIGQLVYTPAPIQSIQEWTLLNSLPYTSDIPNYFFIYQNKIRFFPIPSTSGSVITFNYKSRVADLSVSDYSTGTILSATQGMNQINGNATAWSSSFPINRNLEHLNLRLSISPMNGDGLWYRINRFTTDVVLDLNKPIMDVPSASNASYTIGQFPIIHEDFHDMLVYGALKIYYTSIVEDVDKFKLYDTLYSERLQLMENYLSDKSINVDLGEQPFQNNPNLFIYAPPA